MALRKSTYESHLKRLGELDKERRTILNAIRNAPEYVLKHVHDKLIGFIKNENWFVRKNGKNEEAYFHLLSYTIDQKTLGKTDRGSVLVNVALEWEKYDYDNTEKKKITENVQISAFNEIDNQILNGRVHTPNFSEKVIQKNILTTKKKQLEDQLKLIKTQLASV